MDTSEYGRPQSLLAASNSQGDFAPAHRDKEYIPVAGAQVTGPALMRSEAFRRAARFVPVKIGIDPEYWNGPVLEKSASRKRSMSGLAPRPSLAALTLSPVPSNVGSGGHRRSSLAPSDLPADPPQQRRGSRRQSRQLLGPPGSRGPALTAESPPLQPGHEAPRDPAPPAAAHIRMLRHPGLGWKPDGLDGAGFNEAFQKAHDTPAKSQANQRLRLQCMRQVADAFAAACATNARVGMAEVLHVAGELLRGGVRYTLARSPARAARYGSAAAAERMAALEIQALRAVASAGIPELHVPLSCIVVVGGDKVLCECDVGLDLGEDSETLEHGSMATTVPEAPARGLESSTRDLLPPQLDPTAGWVDRGAEARFAFRLLNEALGLRSQQCCPYDVQCHRSPRDGRIYVRNACRLLPRALYREFLAMNKELTRKAHAVAAKLPASKGIRRWAHRAMVHCWLNRRQGWLVDLHCDVDLAVEHERLRPEFVWGPCELMLTSDALCPFVRTTEGDSTTAPELRFACGTFYGRTVWRCAGMWAVKGPLHPAALAQRMHDDGINMRCLGLMAQWLEEERRYGVDSVQMDVVRTEMAARAFKTVARQRMRESSQPPETVAMVCLRLLLGAGLTRVCDADAQFWRGPMAEQLKEKFGVQPFGRMDLLHIRRVNDAVAQLDSNAPPLPDIRNCRDRDRAEDGSAPLLSSAGRPGCDPLLLRHRACEVLGIRLFYDPSAPGGVGCRLRNTVKHVAPARLPAHQQCLAEDDYARATEVARAGKDRARQKHRFAVQEFHVHRTRVYPYDAVIATLCLAHGDTAQGIKRLRELIEVRCGPDGSGGNTLDAVRLLLCLSDVLRVELASSTVRSKEVDDALRNSLLLAEGSLPGTEITASALCVVARYSSAELARPGGEPLNDFDGCMLLFKQAQDIYVKYGCNEEIGLVEADLGELLASRGKQQEALAIYCKALRRLERCVGCAHPSFLCVLWSYAVMRGDESALAAMLPAMREVLDPHGDEFRNEMYRYGQLAMERTGEEGRQSYAAAQELYIEWLRDALCIMPPALLKEDSAKWPAKAMTTVDGALGYLRQLALRYGSSPRGLGDQVELHRALLAMLVRTLGPLHPLLLRALRPLGAALLRLARSGGGGGNAVRTAEQQWPHLLVAGDCFQQTLRVLIAQLETLEEDERTELTASIAGTARLLKHDVADVMHEHLSDAEFALTVSTPEDMRQLLSFWDTIHDAEVAVMTYPPTTQQLASRLRNLDRLVELSRLWGGMQQTLYYQSQRKAVQEHQQLLLSAERPEAPAPPQRQGADGGSAHWRGQSPPAGRTPHAKPASTGCKTSTRGSFMGSIGSAVSEWRQPGGQRDAHWSGGGPGSPRSLARAGSSGRFQIAVAPSVARPGQALSVSWQLPNSRSRAEHAWLALLPSPCPPEIHTEDILARYEGYRVHKGGGTVANAFKAPLQQGQWCVAYFASAAPSRPPPERVACFSVSSEPPKGNSPGLHHQLSMLTTPKGGPVRQKRVTSPMHEPQRDAALQRRDMLLSLSESTVADNAGVLCIPQEEHPTQRASPARVVLPSLRVPFDVARKVVLREREAERLIRLRRRPVHVGQSMHEPGTPQQASLISPATEVVFQKPSKRLTPRGAAGRSRAGMRTLAALMADAEAARKHGSPSPRHGVVVVDLRQKLALH
eukprot:TRINITY_DN16777_c0_g1_i1.p1 TRINITY_DN16777_c0_g1~~TRINITY_DN16777_c0_g1_i1.p1  ORF type:complete len:1676 (+),score=510.82 TRINITY_DN16777_c0_g1_i1:83-5110(+)